jgi:hypothetical protein
VRVHTREALDALITTFLKSIRRRSTMTLYMISAKFVIGVGTAFGAFPDVERTFLSE